MAATTSSALDLDVHRGQVVLLDFWASWCAPCLRSFPWMEQMQSRYGSQGLVVIAVNVDRERAAAEKFLTDAQINFEVMLDGGIDLAKQFEVRAMPTSFVIGRDGKVAVRHMGFKVREKDAYEETLLRALAQPFTDQNGSE
ncbi:MAG: TlpA family protein disulfide reductase [Gammaproteobacteria bacterium]